MLADGEARLAEPLERFSALHAATLRGSRAGVIDLSYPNPRTDRDPRAFEVLRILGGAMNQDELQYTPMGGGTLSRRRIATALSRRFGVRLGFRQIVLTPGATAALMVTFAALFEPGDEILVPTPCWMDYPLYLHRLGLTCTPVPCRPDKRLDVEALAAACGSRTAAVVISQPACPTGVLHTAADLDAVADVLRTAASGAARPILLISDEVHRDQVWDGTGLTVPMQLYPDTVSVYSFGKAWSLQGQRTGYLALGPGLPEESTVRVERAMRSTGFCAPTALMQRLVHEIADLEPSPEPLRRDQMLMRGLLAGIGYRVIPGQATAFIYVSCPDGADDWEFTVRLARLGLLAMPSTLFHEPGHFRLALNVGAEQFDEVGRRLRAAFPVAPASPS